MKKEHSFVKGLFYFSLFFSILWSNHAWFTWWIGDTGTLYRFGLMVLCLFAFLYQLQCRVKFRQVANISILTFIYLVGMFISGIPGITFIFGTLLKLYPLLVLTQSPREDQIAALRFISKGMAILLVPGLITYFVLLGNDFPGIPYPNGKIFYIYGFVIRDMGVDSIGNFYRFPSVFLEPGYLGVLMAFLLYANNFNLREWYNKVILVALIASFSLGGYVVAAIAYCFSMMTKGKFKMGPIILSVLLLGTGYVMAKSINDGDNVINNLIIKRLEPSGDDKGIEGNNRFSSTTDYYYETHKSDLFFGLGPEKVEKLGGGDYESSIAGAGYKVYFLTFGIASALCFFVFYFLLGRMVTRNRRYMFYFFLLIVTTFVFQAEITSAAWYLIYFLGCACTQPIGKRKTMVQAYEEP